MQRAETDPYVVLDHRSWGLSALAPDPRPAAAHAAHLDRTVLLHLLDRLDGVEDAAQAVTAALEVLRQRLAAVSTSAWRCRRARADGGPSLLMVAASGHVDVDVATSLGEAVDSPWLIDRLGGVVALGGQVDTSVAHLQAGRFVQAWASLPTADGGSMALAVVRGERLGVHQLHLLADVAQALSGALGRLATR